MKPSSRLWRFVRRALAAVLLVVALLAVVGWYKLFRTVPQHFDSVDEQFKYGSIGTEEPEGLPYWVWVVLPRVFPDKLPGPGGYASLGLLWEQGRETPVGFSKMTIGFPRVGINCALCHAGSYRTDPSQYPTLALGGPATTVNVLGYERFLFACANDDRFTADKILPAIEYSTKLSPLDKLLYRYVIIPRTRKGLKEAAARFSWTNSRPDWGRGRIDPFNPVKFHQLKMDPKNDDSIGNSDMEPIWNLRARTGHLHWDGLNDSLREVMLSSAVGDGATAKSLPVGDVVRLENWLLDVKPPAYPFPVDAAKARKGEEVFTRVGCAECHAHGGRRNGTVIPIAELGTDDHRLKMWSQAAANIYNNYPTYGRWKFQRFQKNDGYVATPLDGLWLRAPYLHNGSVPTVDALLEPKASRPESFWRGYDVYDRDHLGFVTSGPQAERQGWLQKRVEKGNDNGGHEGPRFGTDLPADDKKALLEYLKTL